jgi:hypothetical protein
MVVVSTMKKILRWIIRFLLLCLTLAVGLILFKDPLLRNVVKNRIRSTTGMTAKIGKLEVGLLFPTITIEDMKLYNSAEFGGSIFLDLPELYLEYDPSAIAEKKLHLDLVRLNLKEINIVRKPDGISNLKRLEEVLKGNKKNLLTNLEYDGIDTFNLTMDKVSITEMKTSENSEVKSFDIGLKNRVFTDIETEEQLTSLVFKNLVQQFFKISIFGTDNSGTIPSKQESP